MGELTGFQELDRQREPFTMQPPTMSPLDCCLPARLRLSGDVDAWLIAEGDVRQFWVSRLRLFHCPSCGQCWLWRSELVGHQERDITWNQLPSQADFEVAAASQQADDERRQGEQKLRYEQLGLDWPSGRQLR